MRMVIKADLDRQVGRFIDALEDGQRSIEPDLRGLQPRAARVFEDHRDRVIHVGVSDGIQEVSPEHKLGLWESFPLTMPVEDTLSVDLAHKRDRLVRDIQKKTISENTYKINDLVDSLFERYLKSLKISYQYVARDWLRGEGDEKDVLKALKDTFMRTDYEAERIFRTETTNYFNESRQSYFKDNTSVDYMELYAVTDGRISKICEDRHEAVVTISEASLKKYMPAFHPHCRTIQRPLLSYLSSDRRIIDRGLALRAAHESSWTPTAWEHSRAA